MKVEYSHGIPVMERYYQLTDLLAVKADWLQQCLKNPQATKSSVLFARDALTWAECELEEFMSEVIEDAQV